MNRLLSGLCVLTIALLLQACGSGGGSGGDGGERCRIRDNNRLPDGYPAVFVSAACDACTPEYVIYPLREEPDGSVFEGLVALAIDVDGEVSAAPGCDTLLRHNTYNPARLDTREFTIRITADCVLPPPNPGLHLTISDQDGECDSWDLELPAAAQPTPSP